MGRKGKGGERGRESRGRKIMEERKGEGRKGEEVGKDCVMDVGGWTPLIGSLGFPRAITS